MADVSSEQPLSELSNCMRSYYASKKEFLNNLSQLRPSALGIGRYIRIKFMSKLKGQYDEDKEFDIEKFIDANFPECCHDICSELRIINRKHDLGLTDLDETERLLSKKEVSVSFYGSYNAGKSTLLNAILQNEFLPMGDDPETGLKLIIQPTFESEEFMTQKMKASAELDGETFPNDMKKNCLKKSHVIIANGVKGVHDTLKNLNQRLRNDEDIKPDVNEPVYLLKAEIPLKFPVHDGWMLSLIDTPGYNEHITKAASAGLNISSACLFITTNDSYRGTDTAEFLKKMYKKSKGIFKEGRLIIVMNKLDQITSGEDIRKKVCEYIQDKVCRCEAKDIPREAVIPVYGKWAFEARMLAGDQSNDRRKETVARILSQRSSQPFGQGEDCGKVLAEKPSEDLAKELEQISNITILERRLQDVAKCSISLWIEKLKDDLSSYCQSSKSQLSVRRQELEKLVKELDSTISTRLEAMTEIYEHNQKISNSIKNDCVRKDLKKSYEMDMKDADPLFKVKREIEVVVDDFKKESTKKEKAKDYEPQAFDKDMEDFLNKVRGTILKEIKNCFSQMLNTHHDHLTAVDRTITKMGLIMRERLGPCIEEYNSMEHKVEALKYDVPTIKEPDFSKDTVTIKAPPVYINIFDKIKELHQDMIRVIKESLHRSDPSKAYFSSPFKCSPADEQQQDLAEEAQTGINASHMNKSTSSNPSTLANTELVNATELSVPTNTEDSLADATTSSDLSIPAITKDESLADATTSSELSSTPAIIKDESLADATRSSELSSTPAIIQDDSLADATTSSERSVPTNAKDSLADATTSPEISTPAITKDGSLATTSSKLSTPAITKELPIPDDSLADAAITFSNQPTSVTSLEQPATNDSLAEAAIYSEQPTSTTNNSELFAEDPEDTITSSKHTHKKVVIFRKKRKWTEDMDSAVKSLSENIDNDVQQYFDKFEEYALNAYWSSYCELAVARLKIFHEEFKHILDKQIKDLKKAIERLQRMMEKHNSLTYECVLVSFFDAQLQTVADKYRQDFV